MALTTAGDLIAFALRASSITGVGQTAAAEDARDALVLLNMILAEWQLNRWLVLDLVEAVLPSTGAASYTVAPAGSFVLSYNGTQRPERIDSAYARLVATGVDSPLYPFMARETFDRIAAKSSVGPPEAYFYDASAGATGTIYFYPVPDATWSLHIKTKASLGQFGALTTPLTLPAQYTTALMWSLAKDLRAVYGLPEDAAQSARAQQALISIAGSGAQLAQAQQPRTSQRSGIYSHVVPAQPQEAGR